MSRVRLPFTISLVLMCLYICAAGVNAALVKTDLIGGLGEFEFSADTHWQMATTSGWPTGVETSTPEDSVAAGWSRLTGYGVVPEQDTIYKIAAGKGLNGSSCQYMAIKNHDAAGKSTFLQMFSRIYDDKPFEIHHGDVLTFRIDRIFMSDYTLPKNAWVKYRMTIVNGGNYTSLDLKPSTKPFSAEVTAPIVPDSDGIFLWVEVNAGGDTGNLTPGIYVDGARLYRKSAGSNTYDKEQVPVTTNRSIKSNMTSFQGHVDDPYAIARDYDSVILQYEADYPYALRFRYYNPDIKVFLYELGGGVTDWRDVNHVDPPYSNCPFGFNSVLSKHLDWLYPWPNDFTPLIDIRQPWLKDTNCVFAPDGSGYFIHLDNPSYQQQWRLLTADKIKQYHLDGVVTDAVEEIQANANIPINRSIAECQSFEHGVFPYLRQSGAQIAMNCSTGILSTPRGNIYFNPSWKTDATYTPENGYENNTPQNTPDIFFQEWSFFKHWPVDGVDMNNYDIGYWNDTMNNIETIATWNRSLSAVQKKSIYSIVKGVDRLEDPAEGLDGWIHFGLCSFLLAQNDYAWFGAFMASGRQLASMDLSCTTRLGNVASNRGMLTSDKSLQMRMYKNGLVIVNGHPNDMRSYKIPTNMIDENGKKVKQGSMITLKPHSGRIFFLK